MDKNEKIKSHLTQISNLYGGGLFISEYCESKTLEEQTSIWFTEDLRAAFKQEIELLNTMSPEEVERHLYGSWESYIESHIEATNVKITNAMGVPRKYLGDPDYEERK